MNDSTPEPKEVMDVDDSIKDSWAESDMIIRWTPEFLKIVGKHSKLWNHPKSETLLLLDEWLIDYVAQQNAALLRELLKHKEQMYSRKGVNEYDPTHNPVEGIPASILEAKLKAIEEVKI